MSMEVGDWSVLHDLGSSTCCRVMAVQHKQSREQAALKVVDLRKMVVCGSGRLQSLEQARCRVKQEADRMVQLQSHPNIVRIHSVAYASMYCYLFMELVTGGELFDFVVSRGKLGEELARYYFRQVISALEYCHGHFIVHRDLKLENVLLAEDGRHIKLIDFGMSCEVIPGKLLEDRCGSPDYVAPEVLRGRGYTGMPSDVWGLGVMLYAMLHGFLPFSAGTRRFNMKERLAAIRCGELVIHSEELSLDAKELLYSLLASTPQERLTLPLLRYHRWVLAEDSQPPPCYLPRYAPTCNIQPTYVSQLCYFDVDPVELVTHLKQGTHCQEVAMYHILALKSSRSCHSLPELAV